jgi:hypothetical protein
LAAWPEYLTQRFAVLAIAGMFVVLLTAWFATRAVVVQSLRCGRLVARRFELLR